LWVARESGKILPISAPKGAERLGGSNVMSCRRVKSLLLACSGVGVLLAATVDANAGGFAIREQSVYGQGTSYAGVAAGGSLSSMFWNPATMTQSRGFAAELDASTILPYASNTPISGSLVGPFFGGTSNILDSALVPAGYMSYQLNNDFWLGMAINSPFGLSVSFPDNFAGRAYGSTSSLRTYNFNPQIAWRVNNWISVGLGVQAQNARVSDGSGIGPIPGLGVAQQTGVLSGTGWGYGATAGVTVTPGPDTTIGLGWRSSINQKIDGNFVTTGTVPVVPGFLGPTTQGPISTTLNLPDIVSLGIRQRINMNWTVMATAEWTRWSRIGTSNVMLPTGAPATLGGVAITLPFQYQNGQFYSIGAEYKLTDITTVRGGVGYEVSPITDMVRIPTLPDNNRTWISGGLSHKISQSLTLDLAYSHAFVKNPDINITATSGNPSFNNIFSYVGSGSAHLDVVSLALKYAYDPAPAPTRQLYTK
jgi:long-chain fatty acid transport protein